jgi:hypothetical protein
MQFTLCHFLLLNPPGNPKKDQITLQFSFLKKKEKKKKKRRREKKKKKKRVS